jgi:hypothetical protein
VSASPIRAHPVVVPSRFHSGPGPGACQGSGRQQAGQTTTQASSAQGLHIKKRSSKEGGRAVRSARARRNKWRLVEPALCRQVKWWICCGRGQSEGMRGRGCRPWWWETERDQRVNAGVNPCIHIGPPARAPQQCEGTARHGQKVVSEVVSAALTLPMIAVSRHSRRLCQKLSVVPAHAVASTVVRV